MPKKKIVLIITIIISTILIALINIPRIWSPEEKNLKVYEQALQEYNNSSFQESYYTFSRVSKSSKLKPAAIYRQALCSEKLGDEKTAVNKYKEVIRYYPNYTITIRAKYLLARSFYNSKKYKKAKKEFTNILKKYSKTDYATAANYYLGSIEAEAIPAIKNEKKKQKSINKASHYFRIYLKEAPSGRLALNSIEKWTSINKKLTNEDNLIIAKAYYENEKFDDAQKYLKFTNINVSWPYFVKNAYALKENSKIKYYTELGLKGKIPETVTINDESDIEKENKNAYQAIDTYLKVSNDPKTALSYLLSISVNSKNYDYILYKSCNNMPASAQSACYNTLYLKYPKGQFAAEALSNIFYEKIKSKRYLQAQKIGKEHLSKFPDSNSAPRVMFWMGKTAERLKNYEEARSNYKRLIAKYPDDYYAYHAFLNLNRLNPPIIDTNDLEGKLVLFPYKRNPQNDMIIKLTEIKDYGLINDLCKDDKFVQSWLAYEEGNYALSSTIARDAMDELDKKPDRKDLRWRLVYPVHYYSEIKKNAITMNNSPILILSIIKEESHFNPKIQSPAGAKGLMQLMPATAKEVGANYGLKIDNFDILFDPAINIKLGNMYYAQLRKSLLNRDVLAVLAYNGGIGSVSSWKENLNYADVDDFVEQIPYPETKNYLKKVYKSYWNYVRIYSDNGN